MNNIELSPKEVVEVKCLARDTRADFGVNGEVPIANDINMILDKQEIILCEYPFGTNSKIDAEIVRFETEEIPLIFIGLNSSLFYDEQIFALAHEIYHFKTKTGKAFNADDKAEDIRVERRADRFAAELLLPESVLKNIVVMEFGKEQIDGANILRVLRFVATIHSKWWLPYKSILLRFKEEKLISEAFCDQLMNDYDPRDSEGEYYKLLKAINKNVAELLNSRTKRITVSEKVIDTILKNYEDDVISEDEFINLMNIFHKNPSDYGYDMGSFDFDADYNFEGELDDN